MRRLVLLLAALLPACTLGPDYVRPSDAVPKHFTQAPGRDPVQSTTPWWLSLRDPLLTELIGRARRASPDLGRARATVAEARAALEHAKGGGAPHLGLNSGTTYGRSFAPPGYYSRAAGYGTGGFDASWELDLWGKQRRIVESATASAEAVQAEADGVMLTLLGDVARFYVELRGIQAQLGTAQAAVDNQRRANALADRRMAGGDGSRLDILQGSALLLQQQSDIPMLEAERQVRINALSTLCGDPPDTLTALLSPSAPIPQGPVPDAGIPADLLRRRPDVRAAERQLAAAIPLVGAAIADKYPSLTLSGTIALSGGSLGSMLASPLFALAPSLKVPLLDGGQRDAVVAIRQAQGDQMGHNYRTVVLQALREVEDAMARLRGETQHRDQLKQTVATALQLVEVARNLYAAGTTDFLQVLDAQKAVNRARDGLAQAEAARTIQVVALFKALGGGWEARSLLASNP